MAYPQRISRIALIYQHLIVLSPWSLEWLRYKLTGASQRLLRSAYRTLVFSKWTIHRSFWIWKRSRRTEWKDGAKLSSVREYWLWRSNRLVDSTFPWASLHSELNESPVVENWCAVNNWWFRYRINQGKNEHSCRISRCWLVLNYSTCGATLLILAEVDLHQSPWRFLLTLS